MAMQMHMITRGWLIYDLTSSPMALAWVMVSFSAPMVIFALFGGAFADRVPKKRLLVITQSFSALATLVLAILVSTDLISFWHLLVVGFFSGTAMAFHIPSRQAIVPDIVGEEKLMNATALSMSAMNGSSIVGPALAGVLIAFLGTGAVFFLITGIYLIAIVTMLMVSATGSPRKASRRGVTRDIKEGLTYVATNSPILGLLIMALTSVLLGMSFQGLMPAWAVEALALGPKGLGFLMAATGVGALGGSLAIASLSNFQRRGLLVLGASLLWGVFLVGFSQSTSLVWALVLLVGLGFFSSSFLTLNMSMTQIYASPEMRGRVMSIAMMTFGLMPLGIVPISAAAEHIGTPNALAIGALLLMVFTFAYGLANSSLRRLA